ncbi:MAG TPA: ABC transporter permease [Pyrinomonadaceae bacterium]|jgi:lipoprotein-releasing system permease protein
MPYELFLALRYLYSRRRRPMARVTALAAIAGIAVGVAALIVALALAGGFRDEMRDKILRGTAHITLMRKDGEAMSDWPAVAARVRSVEGVREAVATTYDGALLSGDGGSSSYAVLRGLDKSSSRAMSELRRTIIEGSVEPLLNDATTDETQLASQTETKDQRPKTKDQNTKNEERSTKDKEDFAPDLDAYAAAPGDASLPHAVIGSELASRAGLHVGDVAQIISGDAQLTPLGLAPRYRRLRIAGIFRTGLYEYDATWIYVSLPVASSLAGTARGSASVISIEVADIYAVSTVAARIRRQMGEADYTTVDWQEANRPLFAALALERRMGAVVIGLIIFIATLNITATLVLVVVERRNDIAILTAMGARARNIMLIFMLEGAAVGSLGALAGVLLGVTACFVGDRYKLVSLPADVYSLSSVPFHTRAQDVALAAIVAFVLSLLATIYPARAAARVRPAEALHDGN